MGMPFVLLAFLLSAQNESAPGWILAGNEREVFALREDGKERKAVERPEGWHPGGVLSPDRSRVVYMKHDKSSEIYIADADGKNVRRLTENEHDDRDPCWHPDGERILFSSTRSGKNQLHAMRSDGSNIEQLTDLPEGAWNVRVSSDGKIAYITGGAGRKLVITEGGTSRVAFEDSWIREPAWSPDGRSLAYVSGYGEDAISIYDVKEKTTRRVKAASIHKDLPEWEGKSLVWRPDGKVVAFRMVYVKRGQPDSDFGDHKLFFAPLDGPTSWIALDSKFNFTWISK